MGEILQFIGILGIMVGSFLPFIIIPIMIIIGIIKTVKYIKTQSDKNKETELNGTIEYAIVGNRSIMNDLSQQYMLSVATFIKRDSTYELRHFQELVVDPFNNYNH